jgi:hypothetical protein
MSSLSKQSEALLKLFDNMEKDYAESIIAQYADQPNPFEAAIKSIWFVF